MMLALHQQEFPSLTLLNYLRNERNETRILLNKIPTELFQLIRDYLNVLEYIQFMNTTKKFSVIKRETIYYTFSYSTSLRYYRFKYFQHFIQEHLRSLSQQLSLKFISSEQVSKMWLISNVHSLEITGCPRALNISQLSNIHRLKLFGLASLRSVEGLGNIPYLAIEYCRNLKDVSLLGNHRELSLSHCPGITHVGHLKNVPVLNLSSCSSIQDLYLLGDGLVQELNLGNNLNIVELPLFNEKLKKLKISGMMNLNLGSFLIEGKFPPNLKEITAYGMFDIISQFKTFLMRKNCKCIC
jgi:hypothetical protein